MLVATPDILPEDTEAALIAADPLHTEHPIETQPKTQTTSMEFRSITPNKSTSHHIILRTHIQCVHQSRLSLSLQKNPTTKLRSTILRASSTRTGLHRMTTRLDSRKSKLLPHKSTTNNTPPTPAAASTRRLQHKRITDHRHQVSNTQCNRMSPPHPRPQTGQASSM